MPCIDKHIHRDKRLLRLERELKRLRHAQGNSPIIPLEHPYQRGWAKTFVLRKDAWHHPEAVVFHAVLAAVNQRVLSRNREFIYRNGNPITLNARIIDMREWVRRAWAIRLQRLFAYGRWSVERNLSWANHPYRHYEVGFKLTRHWWLEESVQPHMITHRRVDLPEVRSRIAEIESYLGNHLGRQRLSWLHGCRMRWRGDPASACERRASAAYADQCE